MKRWWVKVLIGLGVLVIALWMSFLGSGIRAKNAAEQYKDQLRAAGEKLDIAELVPKPLPAESNCAPVFNALMNKLKSVPDDVISTNPVSFVIVAPGRARLQSKEPFWWSADSSNTWMEVDQAVAARKPMLDALASLPNPARMDFDLRYEQGPRLLIPHLAQQKRVAQDLSSATIQAIHSGNNFAALERLTAMLNSNAAVEDERTMISQLVRIAMASLAIAPSFELLYAEGLNDEQLKRLQSGWSRMNFVPVMEHVFEMERYSVPMWIAEARSKPEDLHTAISFWSTAAGSGSGSGGLWDRCKELAGSARKSMATAVWQSSWSYGDERRVIAMAQLGVETSRRIAAGRSFKAEIDWMQHEMAVRGLTNGVADESWMRSVLDKDIAEFVDSTVIQDRFFDKVLQAEAAREVVLTAIAIRRYELRNGKLPESLSELVPNFLPALTYDPADGKSLRYRRSSDNSFVLYSVGKDGVDNGGSLNGLNRSHWWLSGEDWVWPQPASEAEVEAFRISASSK